MSPLSSLSQLQHAQDAIRCARDAVIRPGGVLEMVDGACVLCKENIKKYINLKCIIYISYDGFKEAMRNTT